MLRKDFLRNAFLCFLYYLGLFSITSRRVLKTLIPFPTKSMCEAGFLLSWPSITRLRNNRNPEHIFRAPCRQQSAELKERNRWRQSQKLVRSASPLRPARVKAPPTERILGTDTGDIESEVCRAVHLPWDRQGSRNLSNRADAGWCIRGRQRSH